MQGRRGLAISPIMMTVVMRIVSAKYQQFRLVTTVILGSSIYVGAGRMINSVQHSIHVSSGREWPSGWRTLTTRPVSSPKGKDAARKRLFSTPNADKCSRQ